ncbi:PREDICTED: zinc finger protein 318 [Elephantulus edwardii]|uniref:zinc finger protein 318 n=1 Tax=Elephantulus edwardii TaxID=28737 RepID=UPI0003F0ABAF|nr:PREDICTED: zinc finger protein 318 [Elephantulus edwardii]
MYRSGARSSGSSHRPKDSGGGGSRTGRSSGSSSGSARRASPPPSSSSSSRTPAHRPRSPSGHRSRRASPSPPRGRRCSPSPPRGRRASPTPPRGRRGSPSPPRARCSSRSPLRSRRLFPAGFRGSSRGESRADFSRDGRGDHPGDSGSRRHSPGLRSDSSLEQSLRITVGNDHFCVNTPERRRLSDRLGSPVDNLEDVDRDDLTDDSVFTRSSQCSRGLERYISREEGPLSSFLGQLDEDYRTRETFLHQSDYNPHISCHDELLHSTDLNRDKHKGSYSIQSEERSREAKRPRYDDTEKIHSIGGTHFSFTPGTRNYRQRRRSPSPRFLDPEFRELDLARRKREEEEQSRSLSQDLVGVDNGGSSCPIPGLSSVLPASEPGYSLHRPEEIALMPKKSILKKRIEADMEPSMQLERFSSGTSSCQDPTFYAGHPSLPLSGAIAAFASEIENPKGTIVETALKEPQDNLYQWGPLPGLPKGNSPLRENLGSFVYHKEKLDVKTEVPERHTDFLLPHERANQDGSGFSRILSILADSTGTQEKRRRSFPDIEDEEKFLYGDEEEDLKVEPPPKPLGGSESEVMRQKTTSLPSSGLAIKRESLEETNPEYAKIHDLLKTIGLDIGVAEISKLAARTQERLHGKKPSRSSADHRSSADCRSSVDQNFPSDRHSSDSHRLESRETHHSSTHSLDMSHAHPASPVDPYLLTKPSPLFLKSDHPMGQISGPEVVGRGFQSSGSVRCMLQPAPSAPIRLPHPASLSQFHMPRVPQFAAARIPPNYRGPAVSPASFDIYRHYMAYAATRWPMYPTSQPSKHSLPELHRVIPVTKQASRSRPNLRVIPTVTPDDSKQEETVLNSVPSTQVPAQMSIPSLIRYNPEKISDEKNRASQKQKVIEEREKLKSDRESRQKKMYYLRTELERLHKQQGEMLRKKRREKDGHKDPLLVEVSRLQDNIMKDIAELQQEAEEAEKKQSELDKVAQILGIDIFDKSQKSTNDSKEPTQKPGKAEKTKSPEKVSPPSDSSNSKESKINNEKSHAKSPNGAESPQVTAKQSDQPITAYEYYDAGNHWCKDCNTICGTMFDFFTHMHNKKHTQTLDPYNRPWASKTQSEAKQDAVKRTDKITVPAKGSEFLIPVTGYYCQLCEEFLGDPISGEQHVKGHQHNEKYKKYVDENPLYEERRNLDRQAGLAVVLETERRRQSELKRKLSEKPKEEKEKKAKVMKDTKEDDKVSLELEDQPSEGGNHPEKAENKKKASLKLQLKEETKKELTTSSSFGKFSWKKPEKEEEKTSVVAPGIPKEETAENSRDKEDGKAEAGKAKPIKIKLSGKTVVAHTSPWMPVVTTSTLTKIRPNLPIPSTVLRKSSSTTVSKPAPLNTFLSIKSSGTAAKPLPVVKESSSDLLLPPDIISKAFGGEEVILKGSPEEKITPAKKNEPSHIPEQMLPPPPPPPPLPPVTSHPAAPSSAQTNASALVKSNPAVSQTPSPGFLDPNILNPEVPVAIVASAQPTAIPSDETAPGVSENDRDQALFSLLVRPPPPLSSVFSEQAKKLEKRNSCLATANAKDLYDIFYSSGGKGATETKLSSGPLANGENSTISRAENSDNSSTSTLNSIESQEKLPQDRDLATTSLVNNPEKPIAKTLMSLGKWSIVEHINPKDRHSNHGFLQPLTRLYQSKHYETMTPKTNTLSMWTSGSFQNNKDVSPGEKVKLDLGEPGLPGIEPAPEQSHTHCHTMGPQKLMEMHFKGSGNQDEENQEFHQSKDDRENEVEKNTELGKTRAKPSEGMIKEELSINVKPHDIENSNLSDRKRYMSEGNMEQPKLLVTDREADQPKKMIGNETQSKIIKLSGQTLSSTEAKRSSFPSEVKPLLQSPENKLVKNSAPELLLQSSIRSDMCLTNSPQRRGVSGEEWMENSAPESASVLSRYRSLRLKKEKSKDFEGKMICELTVWSEKKPETWQNSEKPESEALELKDVHPELTVTVENKPSENFETTDLTLEDLAAVGNLGDACVDFCNTQIEPAHRSPIALSRKVRQENSTSFAGCTPSTSADFEPIPSISRFPLDSSKPLVLNLEAQDEQNLSNPTSRRIPPNILKTGLPMEDVDLGIGGLEVVPQALDLLAGGMMSEEIEETSRLDKQESLRLESETNNSSGLGPSPCLPDLVDFVTRTSGVQKDKLCSPQSEPPDLPECSSLEMGPLQLEIHNASIAEVVIPQIDEDSSETPLQHQVVEGDTVSQQIDACPKSCS